jgi:hypothetical protein
MIKSQIQAVKVCEPANWERCLFEDGNITQNKLHTVTGSIPRIQVEQLQINIAPPPIFDRTADSFA